MKIGLIGSEVHAGQMNKMLDNSVLLASNKKQPSISNFMKELKECDIVYIIGFFMPKYTSLAYLFGKRVIVHWIGTDVWNLRNWKIRILYKTLLHNVTMNLSGSHWLSDELKQHEITAIPIPLVTKDIHYGMCKMPKRHAVLSYVPEGRKNLYGLDKIREIAKEFPNIKFYIVPKKAKKEKNIEYLGRIPIKEMNKLYSKISVLLRPTIHDGLSMMVLEALGKGKQVLWSQDFLYCNPISDYKKILGNPPRLNTLGADFVKRKYNKERIIGKLNMVFEDVYRNA